MYTGEVRGGIIHNINIQLSESLLTYCFKKSRKQQSDSQSVVEGVKVKGF